MRKFFLSAGLLILFSCAGTSFKKRISDADYRYEFYTVEEDITVKPNREYFWFKGGLVHNSEYGAAGELLHNDYVKFYHSNQLAEAGRYKFGLKEGYWKTWFADGTLQSKTYWNKGQKDGSFYAYGPTGELVEQGSYKNNLKHGRWINYTLKDTLKYRNGEIVIKKVKPKAEKQKKDKKEKPEEGKKKSFFGRVFSKIGGWFKKKDAKK
jgi:antitoxin component YwqK of YwqJK toxin-antitoxin module